MERALHIMAFLIAWHRTQARSSHTDRGVAAGSGGGCAELFFSEYIEGSSSNKTEEMEQFKGMYQNPLFAVLISYAEVLPIGPVVAFVSALILKRKPAVSAGANVDGHPVPAN